CFAHLRGALLFLAPGYPLPLRLLLGLLARACDLVFLGALLRLALARRLFLRSAACVLTLVCFALLGEPLQEIEPILRVRRTTGGREARDEIAQRRDVGRFLDPLPRTGIVLVQIIFVEERDVGLRTLAAARLRVDVGGHAPEHHLDLEARLLHATHQRAGERA